MRPDVLRPPPGDNAPADIRTEVGDVVVRGAQGAVPGQCVAGRYTLGSVLGAGGGGTVFRARDSVSGDAVAIKMTEAMQGPAAEAFDRESRILAELRHPGIVGYRAHGVTPAGERFLVMDLLEGETLQQRLHRGSLAPTDACHVAVRVLEALAFAHQRGVIHRDIKPSNIHLQNAQLDQVRVLDFGVAREVNGWLRSLTGHVVGTPLYMAPEQARGDRGVDARADVFSVGCVLYECLTGRALFWGEGWGGLAKVALADAILSETDLSGVPAPLRPLLRRMLAPARDDRPGDAAAVAAELTALLSTLTGVDLAAVAPAPALGTREARSLVVLLVGPAPRASQGAPSDATIAEQVAAWGGQWQCLASGAWLITFGTGNVTDQALCAARAALALRALVPQRAIAMTVGRATIERQAVVGSALDQSSRLLSTSIAFGSAASGPQPVIIDSESAALVAGRFEVKSAGQDHVLVAERGVGEAPRPLMGRPVPFVGRDRELDNLAGLFDEAAQEPVARAAIVLAPAGAGKSRLRHELLARIAGGDARPSQLIGQADALRAGTPYGLLASALRGLARIQPDDPPALQQTKLTAAIASFAGRSLDLNALQAAAFLGEIAHIPFDDRDLPLLHAARRETRLMADQVRVAWLDVMAAALESGPVVLVLEDIHWGDAPSLLLVDAALADLRDRPLCVLAFGRPEVEDRFPTLWKGRDAERVILPPLRPRACRELVRAVIPTLDDESTRALVTRAEGNPFFLEELLRLQVAGGSDTAAPRSVLAAVQARLDTMGDDAKVVLRAASVYGESFQTDAVQSLIAPALAVHAPAWLENLAGREIVERAHGARADGASWRFRHALVRDAAYDTLTEQDRARAHGLAAQHLESRGERDGVILGTHRERAGDSARAAYHFRVAAEQALEANDFAAALAHGEHARRLGATGEELGLILLTAAKARVWLADFGAAERDARAAEALLTGDAAIEAIEQRALAQGEQAAYETYARTFAELEARRGAGIPSQAWLQATLRTVMIFSQGAQRERHARFVASLGDVVLPTDRLRGLWEAGLCWLEFAAGRAQAALVHAENATAIHLRSGDWREACVTMNNSLSMLLEIGRLEDAVRTGQSLVALCRRIGHGFILSFALVNVACALLQQRRWSEARLAAADACEEAKKKSYARVVGFASLVQSQAALAMGDTENASAAVQRALAALEGNTGLLAAAEAVAARVDLARGRAAEAQPMAESALNTLRTLGIVEYGEFAIWVAAIEAALASDKRGLAQGYAHEALAALEKRLGPMSDPDAFLAAIPEYPELVALGRTLGVTFPRDDARGLPRTDRPLAQA